MTTVIVKETDEVATRAKRSNLIYTLIVVALIIVSIIVPPPFGSLAGITVALIGIIYGAIIRKRARQENPDNSIAKLGLWLSVTWLVINTVVLVVVGAVIVIIKLLFDVTTFVF